MQIKGKPVLVLDTRRQLTTGENTGKYHIKLRASFRVSSAGRFRYVHRFFPTGVYAFGDDDLVRYQTKPKKTEQDYQVILLKILSKANELLSEDPTIDPEAFRNKLTMKGSYLDPLGAMEAYEAELRENGQIGSADYYKDSLSAWKRFCKQYTAGHLTFAMVTPKLLKKFEGWHRSPTTAAMRIIAMRTVFNLPNIKKKLPPSMYPFGKGGYQIPKARGRKLALTEVQKDKILKYKTLNPTMRKAIDMWIFSYFCNGMNFADIARLKYSHIQNGVLTFERTKTIRKSDKSLIVITLRPEVEAIIRTHGGGNPTNVNDYIFDVINDDLTQKQIKGRVHRFISDTNEMLDDFCQKEGLPKITTYSARHTYATVLKRKGVSIEYIQESLGHADPKTTQAYLDSFDLDTKRKNANML